MDNTNLNNFNSLDEYKEYIYNDINNINEDHFYEACYNNDLNTIKFILENKKINLKLPLKKYNIYPIMLINKYEIYKYFEYLNIRFNVIKNNCNLIKNVINIFDYENNKLEELIDIINLILSKKIIITLDTLESINVVNNEILFNFIINKININFSDEKKYKITNYILSNSLNYNILNHIISKINIFYSKPKIFINLYNIYDKNSILFYDLLKSNKKITNIKLNGLINKEYEKVSLFIYFLMMNEIKIKDNKILVEKNKEVINKFVESGSNINDINENEKNVLFFIHNYDVFTYIVEKFNVKFINGLIYHLNNVKIMNYLLYKDIKINNNFNNNLEIQKIIFNVLKEKNVNIESYIIESKILLHYMYNNLYDNLKYIFENFKFDINHKYENGNTLLYLFNKSIINLDSNIYDLFIEYGIDTNIKNDNGETSEYIKNNINDINYIISTEINDHKLFNKLYNMFDNDEDSNDENDENE